MGRQIAKLKVARRRGADRADDARRTRREQIDKTRLEELVKILREVRQLRNRAVTNDLPMIAYLLDMAALEAEHLASEPPD